MCVCVCVCVYSFFIFIVIFSKRDINLDVISHRKHTSIGKIYLCLENQKEARNRFFIKIRNTFFKNAENIKLVIDITSYVWRKSYLLLLIITPMNCSIKDRKY